MKYPAIQNYINGKFVNASTSKTINVISPLDGNLLSTVPMSSSKDLDDAVKAAQAAFPAWSKTPIKERVQVFFKYKTLLEKHLKELAELCSEENGKTYGESVAEIEKCIELFNKYKNGEFDSATSFMKETPNKPSSANW